MEAKEFFNQHYSKTFDHLPSFSLIEFFNNIVQPRLSSSPLNILELGSGSLSIFESMVNLNAKISAIDFSSEAIKMAPASSRVIYIEKNIADENFNLPEKFDLIFDSHCLNCITDETERKNAFLNIYSSLNSNGLLAMELMIYPIDTFSLAIPYKIIKSALDYEQEIISYGFKIIYFKVSLESGFVNEFGGEKIKCDLLRVIVKK